MTTSSTTYQQNPATYTPRIFPPTAGPTWCTDHTGFDDGSGDWHESRTAERHGFAFYVSTGSMSGVPGLFMPAHGCTDAMSLDDAEAVARAILALVDEARR